QQANRHAERRHLRERQVDEDHLARDDVKSEIRMDGNENQARHEWRQHQLEAAHLDTPAFAPAAKPFARTETHVFIRSKYVFTPGAPLVFSGTITGVAMVLAAT